MLAPGHIAFGMVSYMGLCKFYGHDPGITDYCGVVLGSLMPDIDHPYSRIGKTFPRVSGFLSARFGHRGFTHSLIAIIFLMFTLFQSMESLGQSTPAGIVVALCFGYLSHIVADFCTVTGVPLLWPWRRKNKYGKERGFRLPLFHFRTGGTFEYILTTAFAILLAYNWVY